jgi:hypothetical protein
VCSAFHDWPFGRSSGHVWRWRHIQSIIHEIYDDQPLQFTSQVYAPLPGHQQYGYGPTVAFHLSKLHTVSAVRPCDTDGSSNRPHGQGQHAKRLHEHHNCREGSIPSLQRFRWVSQLCRFGMPCHNRWVPCHIMLLRQPHITDLNVKVRLLDPYEGILVLS